jgi:hypothetical protein
MSWFRDKVVTPNLWHYLVVVITCFAYAFGFSLFGPPAYRSEALLAFKNRPMSNRQNLLGLISNPLPAYLDEAAIENKYDYGVLLYSRNLCRRALGDKFDQLYDPSQFSGLDDFYFKFMSQLAYNYDGEQKVIHLAYTYKDPELAAQFVNGYAQGLEDFMVEDAEQGYMSTILLSRLDAAKVQEQAALDEMTRISGEFDIPAIIEAPSEWIQTYADALQDSYKSESQTAALLAALKQLQDNRDRRDLLSEPQGAPDTTIIKDIVLGALRMRLALLNAGTETLAGTLPSDSPALQRLTEEQSFLTGYLREQYRKGIDVETSTVMLELQKYMVENYLYKARAAQTEARIAKLPGLEEAIRPALRRANVASATIKILEPMVEYTSIAEGRGLHPVQVIDYGVAPDRPFQPAWNSLLFLLPTALFLSTLWFALKAMLKSEIYTTNQTGEGTP